MNLTFIKERTLMKRYVKASIQKGTLDNGVRVWTEEYPCYADLIATFSSMDGDQKFEAVFEAQSALSDLSKALGAFEGRVVTIEYDYGEPFYCVEAPGGWYHYDVIDHEGFYLKNLEFESGDEQGASLDRYLNENF